MKCGELNVLTAYNEMKSALTASVPDHPVFDRVEVHALHSLDAVARMLVDRLTAAVTTVLVRPEVGRGSAVLLEDLDLRHWLALSAGGSGSQSGI